MRAILLAALAVVLVACNAATNLTGTKESPGYPITLSAQQLKDLQAGVRASLKDPESARFGPRTVATEKPNGDIDACGTVNAKNSYGGYVGESPFVAKMRQGKVIDSATASGRDAMFILQICRERGVPI